MLNLWGAIDFLISGKRCALGNMLSPFQPRTIKTWRNLMLCKSATFFHFKQKLGFTVLPPPRPGKLTWMAEKSPLLLGDTSSFMVVFQLWYWFFQGVTGHIRSHEVHCCSPPLSEQTSKPHKPGETEIYQAGNQKKPTWGRFSPIVTFAFFSHGLENNHHSI